MDIFGANLAAQSRVTGEVGEKNGDLPLFGTGRDRVSCRRRGRVRRFGLCSQSRDPVEQLAAVADGCDPKLFEILSRELRQHVAVDGVVAEDPLVLFEPQTLQPGCNVHGTTRHCVPSPDGTPGSAR